MKNAKQTLPLISGAIRSAQGIAQNLQTLQKDFATGKIDHATFAKNLEIIHRHQTTELTAMVANLSYDLSLEAVS